MVSSVMLSTPGEEFGRAATSSRGCIEPASEQAAARPIVRMTQMRILEVKLTMWEWTACATSCLIAGCG
jgi:hypothetical protein